MPKYIRTKMKLCIEIPDEKWEYIEDYNFKFEISNLGRVRKLKETLSKSYINKNGYEFILLRHNLKRKNHYIHRLVALYFISNPENKPEVNHIDNNRNNNNVNNLEWVTKSENSLHSFVFGNTNQMDSFLIKKFNKLTENEKNVYCGKDNWRSRY